MGKLGLQWRSEADILRLISNDLKAFSNTTESITSIFLSGGNTTKSMLKRIVENLSAQQKIEIYLTDERLTNETEHLNSQIFRPYQKYNLYAGDPHKYFSRKKRAKFAIIGFGLDGHIASIFSEDLNLEVNSPNSCETFYQTNKITSAKPPCKRVTVNINTLLAVEKIYIGANTIEKVEFVETMKFASPLTPLGIIVREMEKKIMWYQTPNIS